MDGSAAILFLDNNPEKIKHVRDYCSSADTILVKETPHTRAVKLLDGVGLSLKTTSTALHLRYKSAINEHIVSRIKDWVKAHSQQQKYVLFDWGRTLIQLKGAYLSTVKPSKYEAILEFVCGGRDHVILLRTMFKYLYEHDCKIYILTNNKSCMANRYRGLVRALAKVPLEFICSNEAPGHGNKGVAMQHHKTFRRFCRSRSGSGSGSRRRSRGTIPSKGRNASADIYVSGTRKRSNK